jgi:hypothetical protein
LTLSKFVTVSHKFYPISYFISYQGPIFMLGQTSGWSFRHQNEAKPFQRYIYIYIYILEHLSFLSTAPTVARPQSFTVSYVGTLKKPQRVQITMVNKETPDQHISMPIKPFAKALGPSERVRDPMTRRVHACFDSGGQHFEFVVKCDLTDSFKNSKVFNGERVL